ncbi:hypothetical protein PTSG_03817 [Salpingoeca rosetta]|uniref:RRM domain-containing protein n=1 Tax=Salpingoeca rosetta (strain ATCC 50818 / BSB-021) TaxID=946362 RepID=F2U5H0_SALR5|nr:uncharacterized protein PTSG_03817 [Salpingoeca rosetta]EGD83186.1 hypothetical protein PTSG_03817 [Salpingoeca rosetta]|eukprot:XP_004995550.1 hypothetical protein PTSG_03817 [Salpingoeca rosetta]
MSGGGRPDVSNLFSVKVDNIDRSTREEDLREAFKEFGEIGDIYMPRYRDTMDPRGYAFVRFINERDAEDAIKHMDGQQLNGKEVYCQLAKYSRRAPPPRRPRRDDYYRDDYRRDDYRRDDYRRDDYRRDDYRRDDYRRDDYRRDDYRRDDYRRDDYRRDDYRRDDRRDGPRDMPPPPRERSRERSPPPPRHDDRPAPPPLDDRQ